MTTRKLESCRTLFALATVLAGVAFGEAGCATPGPLHVYSFTVSSPSTIADSGPDHAAPTPSFVQNHDTVTGFAYDPFTDHFFLRLAPGNRFRVVDRPARAIKREFDAEGVPATGGGDLAVRPRDGHLFLVHPTQPALLELTRFGKFVRQVPLEKITHAPSGVAYDTMRDRLLVLENGDQLGITVHDLDGRQIAAITLAHRVGGPLAFDSEKREFYATVDANDPKIAVFSEDGKFVRFVRQPAEFLDVGPRSFIRMF